MTGTSSGALARIRRVSQIRQYRDEPVPNDVLDELLEIARWTGSSRNLQPWHFIVLRDKEKIRALSRLRPNINWAADAAVGIVIVLDGKDAVSEAYDEGRLTERLLTAAKLVGYGGGVAWFGEAEHQAEAKRVLGIPAERTARQMVMIGRPLSTKDPRPYGPARGRKPLAEIVSEDSYPAR